jgi:hypothetical protein
MQYLVEVKHEGVSPIADKDINLGIQMWYEFKDAQFEADPIHCPKCGQELWKCLLMPCGWHDPREIADIPDPREVVKAMYKNAKTYPEKRVYDGHPNFGIAPCTFLPWCDVMVLRLNNRHRYCEHHSKESKRQSMARHKVRANEAKKA